MLFAVDVTIVKDFFKIFEGKLDPEFVGICPSNLILQEVIISLLEQSFIPRYLKYVENKRGKAISSGFKVPLFKGVKNVVQFISLQFVCNYFVVFYCLSQAFYHIWDHDLGVAVYYIQLNFFHVLLNINCIII